MIIKRINCCDILLEFAFINCIKIIHINVKDGVSALCASVQLITMVGPADVKHRKFRIELFRLKLCFLSIYENSNPEQCLIFSNYINISQILHVL